MALFNLIIFCIAALAIAIGRRLLRSKKSGGLKRLPGPKGT